MPAILAEKAMKEELGGVFTWPDEDAKAILFNAEFYLIVRDNPYTSGRILCRCIGHDS